MKRNLSKPIAFLILILSNLSSAFSDDFKKPNQNTLKKILTPEQYTCTQEAGTETPFKNAYWNNHEDGIYVDLVSGEALFSSLDKFDSGTGWPSFTKPIDEKAVNTKKDTNNGMDRTELRSTKADSHLGHVFDDGPGPTHKRFCINSAALKFIPLNQMQEKGYGKYLFDFIKVKNYEIAIVSGGCFWGVQELFKTQKGVITSEVGYIGGHSRDVQYKDVSSGKTGHTEAVRILFDPKQTNYQNLLLYFFKIHDPTTLNKQGNDIGTQYRSEIFFMNESQQKIAEAVKTRVDKSKKWNGPVVTKIERASTFWRAEDYHQDYLQKNPSGYTCHFPRKIEF